MMPVRCFLLEPTETLRRWLRRYTSQHGGAWTCADGWHEAMVPFDEVPAVWETRTLGARTYRVVTYAGGKPPDEDSRWPATCDKCPYEFAPDEVRQLFYDLVYRRVDTGELITLREAPPGAMWDAWWLHDIVPSGMLPGTTVDGKVLMVKCPNGHEWCIDGRASNCTLPHDDAHKCWVRHGVPPDLVVDKAGVTCSAGAGSIKAGDYHGFLGTSGATPGWFT